MVIDSDSESGFLYGSMLEFIKCWENRATSRIILETCNGQAWVNLSCCLGRPSDNHVIPARRSKTKKKEEKDLVRAAAHQQNVTKDASTETSEMKGKPKKVVGFVDCELEVNCSLVEKSEDNLHIISDTIGQSFRKLFNNDDVEIAQVNSQCDDFREYAHVNKMEYLNKVRVYFKQNGDNERDFEDVFRGLMQNGVMVPVARNKRYPKVGKDCDIKVHSLKVKRSY